MLTMRYVTLNGGSFKEQVMKNVLLICALMLVPAFASAENNNPFGDIAEPNPFNVVQAPNPFGDWEVKTVFNEYAAKQDCPPGAICPPPSTNQVGNLAFSLDQPGTKSYTYKDSFGNDVIVTERYEVLEFGDIQSSNVQGLFIGLGTRTSRWQLRQQYGRLPLIKHARAQGRRPIAEFFGAFCGAATRTFIRCR